MKDKFELKNVTVVIDQTPLEAKKSLYYLRATTQRSPLEIQGTPKEIGTMFGQWVTNTIAAMSKNNCTKIKINMRWE